MKIEVFYLFIYPFFNSMCLGFKLQYISIMVNMLQAIILASGDPVKRRIYR